MSAPTDPRLTARDAIVRLAATPAHRGSLTSAAEELAARPHWARRPSALRCGLTLARELVELYGSARQAERAIDGAIERAMTALLDGETALGPLPRLVVADQP